MMARSTTSPFVHHHHHRTNEHVFLEEMRHLSGGAKWVALEKAGHGLRRAHKVFEWDGWEEGLVASCLHLGDEHLEQVDECPAVDTCSDGKVAPNAGLRIDTFDPIRLLIPPEEEVSPRHLDAGGDDCGGIGGELGRRLEALASSKPSLNELGDGVHSLDMDNDGVEEGAFYDELASSSNSDVSSTSNSGSYIEEYEELNGAPDPSQVHFGFHNFITSRTHSEAKIDAFPGSASRTYSGAGSASSVGRAFSPTNGIGKDGLSTFLPLYPETTSLTNTATPSYPLPPRSQGSKQASTNGSTASLVASSTTSTTPSSSAPMTPLMTQQRYPSHIYRDPKLLAPINGNATFTSPSTKPASSARVQGGEHTRASQTANRLAHFLAANGVTD